MDDETYNVVDDTEAGSETLQNEDTESTSEVTEVEETEPVVEPANQQTQAPDVNSQFAAARRAAEAEAREAKAQNERLLQALTAYGYEGDANSIADALFAQANGITPEEAQAQREAQEKQQTERDRLTNERDFYQKIAIEKMMADDLKTIQSVYPEVKDLKELGDEFFSLLSATKDPLLSYEALQAKKAKTAKPVPPEMGAVNNVSTKEKDYYSPSEVDKLTSKDYDDPKIMENVRKSMLKWK